MAKESEVILYGNDEVIPKPGTGKSPVWTYFGFERGPDDQPRDIDTAVCRFISCHKKKVKAKGGNTSNLFQHLKSSHPREYEIAKSQQAKSKGTPRSLGETGVSNQTPAQVSSSATSGGQLPMKNFVPYDRNSIKWKQLTKSVTMCIAKDILPIYSVDKSGFRAMLKSFDSRYELPGRNYFTKTALPALFNEVKAEVLESLLGCDFYALTADMWSSRTTEPFLGVTLHYISNDWELKSHCLQTLYFPESHTAENIAESLENTLSEWNLSPSKLVGITTDNGANIVKACGDLLWPRLSCFGHNLHLAIGNSMKGEERVGRAIGLAKGIVAAFGNSFKRRGRLAAHQQEHSLPQHGLVSECETRWGSRQKMISRIIEQEQAICLTLAEDRRTVHLIPTWQDMMVLNDVNEALEPLTQFTDSLSGDTYVTVSTVAPSLALFATPDFMGEKEGDSGLKSTIKGKILKYINDKYKDPLVVKIIQRSTLLDPRYKGDFMEEEELHNIKRDIIEELAGLDLTSEKTATVVQAEANVTEVAEPPRKKLALSEMLAKAKKASGTRGALTTPEDKARSELENYLSVPVLQFEENPLSWWKECANIYPLLSKLARKYLCITATSSPCERVFSKAGGIVTPKRALLKPEKVNMLTFLATNLN